MNKQFTPGPWFTYPKSEMLQQPGNPPSIELSSEKGVYWIAQIQANAPSHDICEANARLIAAAPEMFELLEFLAQGPILDIQITEKIKQLLTRITTP